MSTGASDTRGQAQARWSEEVAFDAWSYRNGLKREENTLCLIQWHGSQMICSFSTAPRRVLRCLPFALSPPP